MADKEPQLELGPEQDVLIYSFDDADAVTCPECRGSGKIVLFVIARTCDVCEGSGKVWPPPRHEHTPGRLGYWRRKQSFDEKGRLVLEAKWFEPVETG